MTATTDAIEWTRAELRELPNDGRRYEIIDGRLYASPPAGEDHQKTAGDIYFGLRQAAPETWRVLYQIGLLIDGDCLIPDLLVLPPGSAVASSDYNDVKAVQPALVVEIASRSTQTTDQGDKLIAYARAGIPAYWRVDRDGTIFVHRLLEVGAYTLAATIRPGESHDVEWPFPIRLEATQRLAG
jgi:Uma2 family endonuclease